MFTLRKIIDESNKKENKILRAKSIPVSFPMSEEDKETAQYLIDHLEFASDPENEEKYHVRPGVGLAAPQIAVNKRMVGIYIENYDKDGNFTGAIKHVLVNPEIISHSAKVAYLKGGEGCLSVKQDREGFVPRHYFVTVKAFDYLTGEEIVKKFRGFEAIVVQHEIDHLDGVLYIDRINKKQPWAHIDGAIEL